MILISKIFNFNSIRNHVIIIRHTLEHPLALISTKFWHNIRLMSNTFLIIFKSHKLFLLLKKRRFCHTVWKIITHAIWILIVCLKTSIAILLKNLILPEKISGHCVHHKTLWVFLFQPSIKFWKQCAILRYSYYVGFYYFIWISLLTLSFLIKTAHILFIFYNYFRYLFELKWTL